MLNNGDDRVSNKHFLHPHDDSVKKTRIRHDDYFDVHIGVAIISVWTFRIGEGSIEILSVKYMG